MAKKIRTPEEVQASIDKKVARRKIFFGTFTKSLALCLAIALVYSVTMVAFAPAGGTAAGGNAPTEKATEAPKTEGLTQEFLDEINNATKAAASGEYALKRNCAITQAIDVGSATSILNGIIQGVDKNASLDSVVGGFIGEGEIIASVKGGKYISGTNKGKDISVDYFNKDKTSYLLKGMELKVEDIQTYNEADNKDGSFKLQIKDAQSPQRSGGTPMEHATNDFITMNEVQTSINGSVGEGVVTIQDSSTVDYTEIWISGTIVDGKITNLKITYKFAVKLDLKVGLKVTGTGAAETVLEYTDIAY